VTSQPTAGGRTGPAPSGAADALAAACADLRPAGPADAGSTDAGGAATGTAGTPTGGVGARSRSSRWELRRPSASVMRPSAASSGRIVPMATPNKASTCSAVMPGFSVIARMPRAYRSPASSAICMLRGSRCCPCQCSPVAPIFHSTVPSAASGGSASPIWRSASITAGWVGG